MRCPWTRSRELTDRAEAQRFLALAAQEMRVRGRARGEMGNNYGAKCAVGALAFVIFGDTRGYLKQDRIKKRKKRVFDVGVQMLGERLHCRGHLSYVTRKADRTDTEVLLSAMESAYQKL